MTTLPERTSGRAERAHARQSRRPSRLGTAAGTAPKPDRLLAHDAGFPSLLKQVWQQATEAPDLAAALGVLLDLGGHVPADVQLRSLRATDEAALKVLTGLSWRGSETGSGTGVAGAVAHDPAGQQTAFVGELGLTVSGRIVLRTPAQIPLAGSHELLDSVIRLPWSRQAVLSFGNEMRAASARSVRAVADCRQWLAAAGQHRRNESLELLKEAARRTAPFMLYQEDRLYTNFRDLNTITGKTLWPGHPDCALSSLHDLPLELWSDEDAVMVVCLQVLISSASFARIEEANGTQLTPDHVGYLLERIRLHYNAAPGGEQVKPASSTSIPALIELADALRARRAEIGTRVQLYRQIHGALMHKVERIAQPLAGPGRQREEAVCARLAGTLPLAGNTFAELTASLADFPDWLARPHGEFSSGLESLIHRSVAAATAAFEADFAMSRGLRSLPRLIAALRKQDWAEIARWEIKDYFCCVVPARQASRHFSGSISDLADIAWSMSARMQYNSWHFIVGLLPRVAAVIERDHFVPPSIPDIAYHSDQHHHGHVAGRVRFSIRSPQPVTVLERTFNGFVDLRLLRCAGEPFTEQDLLAAHRLSAFIASATTLAAGLAADGHAVEVSSFDSRWHWESITGGAVTPSGRSGPT